MTEPDPPPYQSTLEAYPDHVKAIGMISIEMGNLDFALGDLLGAVLHIDPARARTVYHSPGQGMARLHILKNAIVDATLAGSERREQLLQLTEKAEALMGKRHSMIHDAWGTAVADSATIVRRPVPFREKHKAKPVALSELQDMIARIRELGERVRETTYHAYRDWPPYTRGPRPARRRPRIIAKPKKRRLRTRPKRYKSGRRL